MLINHESVMMCCGGVGRRANGEGVLPMIIIAGVRTLGCV